MSWYNVEYNGKWACFSSVVDAFITQFSNKSEYENWRITNENIKEYKPIEQCNYNMSIQEAVFSISLNRNNEETMACLLETGLSQAECSQIIYDMETKHYSPINKENDKYYCPNCNDEIKYKQKVCKNDTCCLKFVWRDINSK